MSQLTKGSFTDVALSMMRAVAGFLFFQHGAQKLLGLFGRDAQELFSLMWGVGVLELFGGLAIMVGLYTRPVAFVLSGLMAVAYFWRHLPRGFWPIENSGELAMFYCFVFFFLFSIGGGTYSVDGWLRKKR
jgi:putative oxidoreductase